MADDQGDKRGTLYFMQGLESRPGADAKYGKGAQQKVLNQAQAYAAKHNLDFRAIPHTTQSGQIAAAQKAGMKSGDVLLGFSAGGYSAAKTKVPQGVKKIIVGAQKAAGNIATRGPHLQAVGNIPDRAGGVGPQSRGGAGADYKTFGFKDRPSPPGDIPSAPGRSPNLAQVDPRLRQLMSGSIQLFEQKNPGYKVQATSGYRSVEQDGTSFRSGPHSKHEAMDIQIRGPNGTIVNRGSDPTGKYHELARISYGQMQATQPELKGRFAWGGAFGTRRGGGPPDLMHFDLMGERGHWTQNRPSHMGPLPGVQYGRAQTASAAPSLPPQPPPVSTGPQGAANRAAGMTTKLPTVGQLIQQNKNNPAFAPYAGMASSIPDQHLPVDQWKQKHADLYNNPMVPQQVKSIFDNATQARPPVTQAQTSGVQQPHQQPSMLPAPTPPRPNYVNPNPPGSMPPVNPRPQGPLQPPNQNAMPLPGQQQIAGQPQQQQQQGPLSTAGNPLNIPKNLTQSERRGISQFAAGLPRQPQPQQQFPPMPQPRPAAAPSMQDQAVNNIRPPDQNNNIMMPPTAGGQPNNTVPIQAGPQMAMPQQSAPQQSAPQQPMPPPPNNIMMPPTPGGQPNNSQPIRGGSQMDMGGPPMNPATQPGLGGGSPFLGGGSPMSMDWALPANGGLAGGAGGGSMAMMGGGGGFGSGMSGASAGMGGMGKGGGGGGHGGKVNMQAAMSMIPKPIALPPLEGGIQPTKISQAMPPQGDGSPSLSQQIMQFLQG